MALGLWATLAWAGPLKDGAQAFDDGRLDEAIEIWTGAAKRGRRSGVLEYNLGTAWLRKGEATRAIAHLRAAVRLRPRDGSVHHNLALARADVGQVPPPAPLPAAWMAVVTPGELGFLGLLVTGIGSAVASLWRHRGRGALLLGTSGLVAGIVVGGVGAWGSYAQENHPVAVIVDGTAMLRDAASVNAGERFAVQPGTELRVERRYAGFLLVEDGRGRRGWLAEGAAQVGW